MEIIFQQNMDHQTNISELKEKVKMFCEERDWDQFHNAKDLAIGVSTESAELLEHFRWKSDEQIKQMFNDPKKREAIEEEVSDVFYFLLRFSQMYDIDMTSALHDKMKKNEQKYPVEKAKGSNKKYSEL